MQVFLAVGPLGATHEEAHLRNPREVSGSGREGKGMEAEWEKGREHHLQKNNTMDVRERRRDGLKKHQIWTFSTCRDADYRQKHRHRLTDGSLVKLSICAQPVGP